MIVDADVHVFPRRRRAHYSGLCGRR
jgi:hypothetical protein